MNKVFAYLRDSKSELQKVVWPTKKETMTYTVAVIGISLGVAAVIGVLDFALNIGLETIISR